MTEEQFNVLVVHLEYIRERVDDLEDAVLGNNEHGVKGLLTRVGILESRNPPTIRRVAENASSGLMGALVAILGAFIRSTT